jgi:hypothetical protein
MLARAGLWVAYLLSFALGRGALFVAPLLLANLLPAEGYGEIEMAHAAASVVVGVAALGTGSVVPLVVLGHESRATMRGIVAHHLGLVLVCLGALAIGASLGARTAWLLGALFTATLAMQSLGSVHLKTLGRGNASVFLDAGLFGLMAMSVAITSLAGSDAMICWAATAVAAYLAVMMLTYSRILAHHQQQGESFAWAAVVGSGLPLMLGGLVTVLATTSGRLGMGLLSGPVATADYAVLARAAVLPIIAHQLILIAAFRRFFVLPDSAVERLTLQIVVLVVASASGFCLLVPWLGGLLGPAFVSAWDRSQQSGPLIVAQSVLWSAIALNDLVISRHRVMSKVLPFTAGGLALALLVGLSALFVVGKGLINFVNVHSVVMLVFYLVQSGAMALQGRFLWQTWAAAIGSYVAMAIAIYCLA